MIPGTTFNIDIAKEVWQEEAREDGYEDARLEFLDELAAKGTELAAKDAELAAKDAELDIQNTKLAAKDAEIAELKAKLAQ